jgi:amino acid transporter
MIQNLTVVLKFLPLLFVGVAGWTLVTTEVSRAAANDGMFPRAFAWTDRNDTAWFGIVMAALLPSLLMLWSYTTRTGLTVFTDLTGGLRAQRRHPTPCCASTASR